MAEGGGADFAPLQSICFNNIFEHYGCYGISYAFGEELRVLGIHYGCYGIGYVFMEGVMGVHNLFQITPSLNA